MRLKRSGAVGRGFTYVELLVIVVVLVLLALVLLPALNPRRTGHGPSVKDSANVRGIHQGMILFAQNNKDQYPLPSVLDKANHTVALAQGADPTTKDTTAAIISMLIYGTYFGPEICISLAEVNPKVALMSTYQYKAPTGTVNPKLALWDPAFSADFTASGGGNLSYAHMLPSGERLKQWTNTFNDKEAFIGNRGPLVRSVSRGISPSITPAFDAASNTLRIHGPRASWEGNIVYNDNHASFEESLYGPAGEAATTYRAMDKSVWYDLFHFDEPDDPSGLNNFLGIYTQAGPTPAAFKTIWD